MKTFLLLRKFLEQQLQAVREQLAQTATEYLEEMQARNLLPAGALTITQIDFTDASIVHLWALVARIDDEGYTVTHRYLLECHIDKCVTAEEFINNVKIA